MGLISPGPVVIMATFAGYLAYGTAGAMIATACVFLPAPLLVVLPGPLICRYEDNPRLRGFVKGATAAAAGAIAGAAIVIVGDVSDRPASVIIGVAALALLLQKRVKIAEPALVGIAASSGCSPLAEGHEISLRSHIRTNVGSLVAWPSTAIPAICSVSTSRRRKRSGPLSRR